MTWKIPLGRFCLLFLILYPCTILAQTGTPTAVVKSLVQAVQMIKDEDTHKAEASKAKQTANTLLALPELSRRSLDSYWDKLTPEERTRFLQLFTALLEEVAYPKAGEFFADLTVHFEGEEVQGDTALVRTTVIHETEGKIAIDYELRRRNGQWIIWDIYLDDVSLATNLYTQFQEILAENPFAELLRRMQEKLDEARK